MCSEFEPVKRLINQQTGEDGEEQEVCTQNGWKEEEGETILDYGIEVVAAIGMEESTVLVVGKDHTLLTRDQNSLNDQVTQVRGYPSEISID